MAIRERVAPKRPLDLDIWWRWTFFCLIGVIVANLLYYALPFVLATPSGDEDIWLEQPWRVAARTSVFYIPISLIQWLVLRNSVYRAWWWIIITLGSVIVLYPGTIWVLWNLHQWDIASDVWFFGFEGGSVYLVAQWIAMLLLTGNKRLLGLLFVATSLGWLLVLIAILLFSSDLASSRAMDGSMMDQLPNIVYGVLYQCTIGGVLATVLQSDAMSEAT